MTNPDQLDRRRFLTAAALSGTALVGATALGALAPEAAHAAASADPDGPDPNFAEGRVAAISAGVLTVTGSDLVMHRVRLTKATSVWKLHPVSANAIEAGDGLYARGVRMPDDTLAADAVWVNIVNLHVEIAGIGHSWLSLNHAGSALTGRVVPGVTAASYDDRPATSDLSGLRIGMHVQLIGAWRPDTDEIDVATIHAHSHT